MCHGGPYLFIVPASFKGGYNIDLGPAQSPSTLQYILLFYTLTHDRIPTRREG